MFLRIACVLIASSALAQGDDISLKAYKIADGFYTGEDFETAYCIATVCSGIWKDSEEFAGLRTAAEKRLKDGSAEIDSAGLKKEFAEIAEALRKQLLDDGEESISDAARWRMVRSIPDFCSAYKVFNQYRRAAGVSPVKFEFKLSYGCMLHARYLSLNGYTSIKNWKDYHNEDPENQFYTKDGQTAAQKSDVSAQNLVESVSAWFDTYFHRIPALQPHLTAIGMGTWDRDRAGLTPSCADVVSSLNWNLKRDQIILYPSDGQTDVPTRFNPSGEQPEAVKGVDSRKLGYPVTLSVHASQKISDVEAKLVDEEDNEVECYVNTPQNPTNPDEWGWKDITIALLPKEHLKAGKKFTARFDFKLNGRPASKSVSFTTAEKEKLTASEYCSRGLTKYGARKYKGAVEDYSEAIKIAPDETIYWYNRGLAYYCLKEFDSGIKDFTEALRLKPDYTNALEWRAFSYYAKDMWDEALVDFNSVIKASPESEERLQKFVDWCKKKRDF